MAYEKQDLEDRLVELRRQHQELLGETDQFNDTNLVNGTISATELRMNALDKEIKSVEKKLNKL
ncbi:Lmo0654 family protein [Listeria grandensis]|nr:Lmo0654 family protein [Listeria grandensis]